MANNKHDSAGRFAASSSANPHSLTPPQPFGRQANHAISNGVKPPAPKSLTDYKGKPPRPARMPAGAPRPQGMIGGIKLDLAPPMKPQQQQRPQQPEPSENPASPVQPPYEPQDAEAPPALPGTGRLALPPGPSPVETMTAGSPIPPAVDGLLEGRRPASHGVVSLGGKYTRAAHPNALGGLVGGLDE